MHRTNAIRWTMAAAAWAGLAAAWGGPALASPVVDDKALKAAFVEKLGALADAGKTIDGAAVRERVAAAKGATATLPASAAGRAVVARDEIYDAVVPAVVAFGFIFKCDTCPMWHLGGLGTGWIASPDGLVVTNFHVLVAPPAGHHVGVMTSDGEVYAVTEVAAADPDGDAAVVRIDTRGRELPCLALGDRPACGTPVTVVAHPENRFFFLTEGVIARYHSNALFQQPRQWLSVTADYAVGSSGGPVLDSTGRVVGMVSHTVTPAPSMATAAGPAAANQRGDAPKTMLTPSEIVFKDCSSLTTLRAILGVPPAAAPNKPGS